MWCYQVSGNFLIKRKGLLALCLFAGIVTKLTEKQMSKVCSDNLYLIGMILDFVTQSNCDIDTLRKVMYFQVSALS